MALASGPKGNFDEALYDAAQSNLRLARIREILSKKNCDAILLVTGVDSHSSVQSTKAINYLLLGHSGHVLRQDSLGDEDLEEVMVLVHKGGVRLYSTPPVARKLNAITAAWANCEVFVLDEKSHRDQDVFEDHKVAAFKEMVQGFETIGIPESGDPRRTIEKWPIIQSYAVDEQGTRKFFTMSHKIIDVTHELSDVYSSLDLHGFSTMMLTSLELFKRHWTTTLVNLDAVYGGTKLSPLLASKSLREIQDFIAEPLTTYFTYGTLRNPDALPQFGLHGPRVWFGAQTADGTGEDAAPLHMTVTMQDPQSPVWCARTYFLTTGHVPNLEPLGTV